MRNQKCIRKPNSEDTGIKSFLDMIAPSVVKFNPDHFICGNTFRCVSSIPMLEMLRQLPQLQQVYLCLDNDAAGHAASERMATLLKEHGLNAVRLVPQQKDWNDDLKTEQENKMERSALCQTFC